MSTRRFPSLSEAELIEMLIIKSRALANETERSSPIDSVYDVEDDERDVEHDEHDKSEQSKIFTNALSACYTASATPLIDSNSVSFLTLRALAFYSHFSLSYTASLCLSSLQRTGVCSIGEHLVHDAIGDEDSLTINIGVGDLTVGRTHLTCITNGAFTLNATSRQRSDYFFSRPIYTCPNGSLHATLVGILYPHHIPQFRLFHLRRQILAGDGSFADSVCGPTASMHHPLRVSPCLQRVHVSLLKPSASQR